MMSSSDDSPNGDRGVNAFSPIRVRKASDEVLAVLVDAIRGGLYEVGDALPRERDLAVRLGVSRTVLREAIDVLRREGIVSVRRGTNGGAIVQSVENLARVCASVQGATRASFRSLLEVRRTLELTGAVLAGERCAPAQFADLRRLVDMLPDVIQRPKEFWEIDLRFHIAVAEFSDNPFCAEFLREVVNRLSVLRQQFPHAHVPHPEAIRNQRATLAALESRDRALIVSAMDDHLGALEDVILGGRLTVATAADAWASPQPAVLGDAS